MVPSTSSRETSRLTGKQNCFARDLALTVQCLRSGGKFILSSSLRSKPFRAVLEQRTRNAESQRKR